MTLVVILTILSFLVVIATRLRLRGSRSAWLGVHTGAGLVGLVVWCIFLIAKPSTYVGGSFFGLIGLGLWWVVSVAGIALALGARSGGGRRAATVRSAGTRWLPLVIHLLVLVAWVYITYAYATRKV